MSLVILAAYLIGSIPFGLLVPKLLGYGDVRAIGSGNIGATNVARLGPKWLAVLVLLLDAGKGIVAVLGMYILAGMVDNRDLPAMIRALDTTMGFGLMTSVALTVVVGHMFPVWLRFKGGKGVATGFGALVVIQPMVMAVAAGIWLLTAVITRYSSLAAILATLAVAVLSIGHQPGIQVVPVLLLTLLILIKHKPNIQRLRHGTESKIGHKA